MGEGGGGKEGKSSSIQIGIDEAECTFTLYRKEEIIFFSMSCMISSGFLRNLLEYPEISILCVFSLLFPFFF